LLFFVEGGENVARGSLLGTLMGAAHGMQGFPRWAFDLKHKDAIIEEIDTFIGLSDQK
jgi:hypothetical protein